jgi:2-methylisocitrate lyase-like PEP mutase family enzyme
MAAHSPLSARLAEEAGNHVIRPATTAMQQVFRQIRQDRGIHNAHNEVVLAEEILRLQRIEPVKEDETRFLRQKKRF